MHQPTIVKLSLLCVDAAKIRVFSKGPKPDTFKDRSKVVATGHLVPAARMTGLAVALCKVRRGWGSPIQANDEQAWVLDASELTAKCPSRY